MNARGAQASRRIFLRGLGGAVVAAPFLGSVGDRGARAQAVPPPRRLIVMFTPLGCVTTRFFPQKAHGALTPDDLVSTSLRSLAPYSDRMLIPRGIRAMNEWTPDLTRGQGNDTHTQVVGSYFTCQPVTPNSNDPFSFDTATRFNAKPIGPSLDHVIARQLSPNGLPLFVRVGGASESPQSAISYSASETPHAGYGSASAVFSELTGLFRDGAPTSPDSHAVARGKSILDAVQADLETLERLDMSASDKRKLEAWKELLHSTGSVIGSEQCRTELAAGLGLSAENLAQESASGDRVATRIDGTMLDRADLYSNVAVLAAACNANPVIFLKYPSAHVYSGLGLTSDSHGLSHRVGSAATSGTCVTDVIEQLLTIDDFYASKFAQLVGRLHELEEGDGKMIDHCAAVWFQEMSDGLAHNLNNLPIVQVGSAGGYFKTGWAVNLWDGSPSLHSGKSEVVCDEGGSMEVDGADQATGTPPELANAPINKYFVSLMNALGVRAGADGFPAPDGPNEVTHFGRYDKTEDFIGGDVNPPMLHSPGGFDALRAGS